MATVNIYDMADTWNDAGTTFTAIKMDVTDTSSASGSLLMDLKVGGSSKFSVGKSGLVSGVHASIDFSSRNLTLDNNFQNGFWLLAYGNQGLGILKGNVGAAQLGFSSSNSQTNIDLILSRKGTANLQLGSIDAAGPVAQTLSVQSVVAGTTNTAGQDFTIQGSAGTGSGAGGSIIFQVAPAGGSGTGQNTLVDALTINSSKQIALASDGSQTNPVLTFGTSNTGFYGGASSFTWTLSGGAALSYDSGYTLWLRNNSGNVALGSAADVRLYRDAANTLALRNVTNAQEFRVYKTTTGTVYKALLGDNNLIKISGEAFTDGAGASTGTLTNAPAAGNPTKWIPIDDNGTTRYIPAW